MAQPNKLQMLQSVVKEYDGIEPIILPGKSKSKGKEEKPVAKQGQIKIPGRTMISPNTSKAPRYDQSRDGR